MTNQLHAAATELTAAGMSVVPVRNDGSKAPTVKWADRQDRVASTEELERWFSGGAYDGLGVLTGTPSGNLEMLEVEGRAAGMVTELKFLMEDNGFGDLWARICSGWFEMSPSGGFHWLYRVEGAARPNTKLARRPNADNPKLVDVLIETRGEGGFTVTAPSAGRAHPSGAAWALVGGGPATVPTISIDDRDALYAIASILDEMPVVDDIAPTPVAAAGGAFGTGDAAQGAFGGLRPGDDYNARATWDEVLTPHGWTKTRHFGGSCYGWTRPDKKARDGISATTGRNDGDNLFVFSSSTQFDTEKAYSKFAAYAVLEHGGSFTEAARALKAAGYGTQPEPRPVAAVVESVTAEAGSAAPAQAVVPPAVYSETDDGNALRLVDQHGEHLRYCPEAGAWLRWDGHRWAWDVAGHVHELARGIARSLPTYDKPAAAFARRTMSNNGLKGLVNVARTDPRIVVSPDQLDGRPYELNTPGGVIDLRTGVMRAPDPVALHTRSTPIVPDFEAAAPRWERFLADTFAGDPTLTTYVQRLLGVSLIGEHLEQLLPFGWGSGANGKSTLLNVVQGVIGTGHEGYSIPAPAELLLSSVNRSHPTELARLSGARLVVASELEDGERFAESRIKMLTGGENIAARFMGKDFFSFKPTHTIWLLANDQPAVRAGGPAFWRRLRLLPFVHVVPPAERIAGLDHALIESEGPAILAWLIRGTVAYLADGLAEPDSVRAATTAYERDQDTVARFVEECCETGPANAQLFNVRVSELRAAYETWCRIEGETPVSAKALGTALVSRFSVASTRSTSARFYSGIRMTDASSPADPTQPEAPENWWNR